MEGIYYNTNNDTISLLRFYSDNFVIRASYGYTDDLSDSVIEAFDRNHLITKLHPDIYSKTKYTSNGSNIQFVFDENNLVAYDAQIKENGELIIDIENHTSGYRTTSRYSDIKNFPDRNDNIEYTKEFYPIILLPNKIIQNIKSDVQKEKIYEYLNLKLPKLEKLKLPNEPKSYRYVTKESSKFQGDGCISIAQIPMAVFFAIMFFYCLSDGSPLLGLMFLVFAVVMGKDIFNFKTVKTSERENLSSEMYSKLRENYRKEKRETEEKNKTLEQEYNNKLKEIDNQISKKTDGVKHKIFLSNLSPLSKAVRSKEEGKRGKSELHFLNKLFSEFGNQIKVDMAPTNDYQFYFPDFTFVCEKTGLHIDIEIDEPYSFADKKPIHHTETNDDERNRYFLEQNWCIIRFSEKQIIQETDKCVLLIKEIIKCIHSKKLDFPTDIVTTDKRWTYEEALVMSHNNIRNQY